MSTAATDTTTAGTEAIAIRILREGYGDGAWHGPDLKAALGDVAESTAFWRPAPPRHSIAEIALHHAYYVRVVRARLSGAEPEPFVLEGDDWFALPAAVPLSWLKIRDIVAREHQRLAECCAAIESGATSPLSAQERFDQILGITCHAIYHAGQVQLIKRLATSG